MKMMKMNDTDIKLLKEINILLLGNKIPTEDQKFALAQLVLKMEARLQLQRQKRGSKNSLSTKEN